MTTTPNKPIESPCVLICQLDLESGWCAGCGRTRHEIAMWRSYTDAERTEVMTELPARMREKGWS